MGPTIALDQFSHKAPVPPQEALSFLYTPFSSFSEKADPHVQGDDFSGNLCPL
jgi:hypothetical protein